MGRHRDSKRSDWPKGLYERPRGHRIYYAFRLPGSKREVSLGSNLEAAKEAVEIYYTRNKIDDVTRALNRLDPPTTTTREHFDWFAEKELATWLQRNDQPSDSNTLDEYRGMLDRAVQRLDADRAISEVSYDAVIKLLRSYSDRTSNNYRELLSAVFRSAVARGLCSDNPVDVVGVRQRANK